MLFLHNVDKWGSVFGFLLFGSNGLFTQRERTYGSVGVSLRRNLWRPMTNFFA